MIIPSDSWAAHYTSPRNPLQSAHQQGLLPALPWSCFPPLRSSVGTHGRHVTCVRNVLQWRGSSSSSIGPDAHQYDGVIGLLQLLHAHVLPNVHVPIEAAARELGGLRERVHDILSRREDPRMSHMKGCVEQQPQGPVSKSRSAGRI